METQGTAQAIITEDVEIVGTVKSASAIHIDGKLNGDLSCSADAVIGKNAVIRGNISVDSTTVLGQVNGNIMAKDRIELKSSAKVTGDIKAKRLSVEDGVSFVGKSEVNPLTSSARRPKSPGSLDAIGADGNMELEEIKTKLKKGVKDELAEKPEDIFSKK